MGIADVIADRMEGHVRGILVRGMVRELPYRASLALARRLVAGIVASLLLVLTAVTMWIFGFVPSLIWIILLCLLPLPLTPFIASYFKLKREVSRRKEETEHELPFFTALSSIIAHCGGTPYMAFQHVRREGKAVFPRIAAEAEEIERKSTFAGMGVLRAMETHAESHPNDGFSTFVATSTSVWRSGGDLPSTIDDLNAEAVKRLENRFDSYASMTGTLAEVITILLMILPLGISISALANPDFLLPITLIFGGVIMPITCTILYVAAWRSSPKKYDRLERGPEAALSALAVSMFIGIVLCLPGVLLPLPKLLPLPVSMAMASATGLGCAYAMMRGQLSEIEQTEKELKRFLRIAVEYRKLGLPMSEALKRAAQQPYKPLFKKLVRQLSARISMGFTIFRAVADARSWLMRVVFFLLDAADRFGGAPPQLLERIVSLLGHYKLCRDRARDAIKLYAYLACAMPVIGAIMVGLIAPCVVPLQLTTPGQPSFGRLPEEGAIPMPSPEFTAQLIELSLVIVVLGSVLAAFCISRAVNLHPWDFRMPLIVSLISVVAYPIALKSSDIMVLLFFWGGMGGVIP